MKTAVITCTGGRFEGMRLCQKYIERQTDQDFFWVVVDDVGYGAQPKRCDLFIAPKPRWCPGMAPTLLRNLTEAFKAIQDDGFELVLFVEDDDWYHPTFVAEMKRRMREAPPEIMMVGETNHWYFNVKMRAGLLNRNGQHAALCATGIRGEIIPRCLEYTENDIYSFFDFWLWKKSGLPGLLHEGDLVVGIKGLPGRHGIGMGHSDMFVRNRLPLDDNLQSLRRIIGDDADSYLEFYDETAALVNTEDVKPTRRRRRVLAGQALAIAEARKRRR